MKDQPPFSKSSSCLSKKIIYGLVFVFLCCCVAFYVFVQHQSSAPLAPAQNERLIISEHENHINNTIKIEKPAIDQNTTEETHLDESTAQRLELTDQQIKTLQYQTDQSQ